LPDRSTRSITAFAGSLPLAQETRSDVKFKYEDLEVWQLAVLLVKQTYPLFSKLPRHELFELASQGRRAVVSIALNIAEGSARTTDRDFGVFINRAVSSLQEIDAVLKLALSLDYIDRTDYEAVSPLIEKQYYKLVAFQRRLGRGRPIRDAKHEGE
jgi:four helix bundle protein